MAYSYLPKGRMQLYAFTSPVISSFQHAIEVPFIFFRWLYLSASNKQALLQQNTQLKEQILTLKAKSAYYQQVISENQTLSQLLKIKTDRYPKVEVARPLTILTSPYKHQIVLNKGENSGLFVGQAVMDDNGIIGQIVAVFPTTSIVMLLSDANSAVPVFIERNNIRSILIGNNQADKLLLMDVPKSTHFKVGDKLLTSGLGGRYPKGYPVGVVKKISIKPSEAFAHIEVKPLAGLNTSQFVLLLWK